MKSQDTRVSPSPFVFSGLRLGSAFAVVLVTLLVQIALMAAFADVRSLIVIAASLIGAAVAELSFSRPFSVICGSYKKFSDGAAVISGLLTGFLLPSAVNPFFAGIVSFFGLFVSRNFFNGKGNAWINASALSVLFVFLSSPAYCAAVSALPEFYAGEAAVNNALFRSFRIRLPEGYISLFFNPQAPVPAFKFNIVTIFSAIVLLALNIADWIVPLVFLAVYAAEVCLFSHIFGSPPLYPPYYAGYGGNILFALFSGGIFFAALYMLSDFSTIPKTCVGRLLLGAFAGTAAFFICGRGGASALGSAFAVFAANIISAVIEYAENRLLRAYPAGNVLENVL